MLKIKLLNEQLTLNNFSFISVKEYVPNYPLEIKVQISDSETTQRLIPSTDAKMNALFQKRDGTTLTKVCTMIFDPDDRSMWEASLTASETNDIVGGNVQFVLDFDGDSTTLDLADATDLRTGMAYSVLAKVTFDGEC